MKNDARVKYTKMVLKDSLLALMREKPAGKITVKELCEGAELNRTTFYLHYGKPADVLAEIEDELIGRTQACLRELKEENAVFRLQALLEYIRDNREMFRAVMCEHGTDSFRRRFFESVFPDGVMNDTWQRDQQLQSYTEGYLVSGTFAAVYTWLLNDCALSPVQLAELVCGLSRNAVHYFRE